MKRGIQQEGNRSNEGMVGRLRRACEAVICAGTRQQLITFAVRLKIDVLARGQPGKREGSRNFLRKPWPSRSSWDAFGLLLTAVVAKTIARARTVNASSASRCSKAEKMRLKRLRGLAGRGGRSRGTVRTTQSAAQRDPGQTS